MSSRPGGPVDALNNYSELKARMRQVAWQEGIKEVVQRAHEKPVIRRLERLLAA
jgi:hypothetical protein